MAAFEPSPSTLLLLEVVIENARKRKREEKSLITDELIDNVIAEWASYYERWKIEQSQAAVEGRRAKRVV